MKCIHGIRVDKYCYYCENNINPTLMPQKEEEKVSDEQRYKECLEFIENYHNSTQAIKDTIRRILNGGRIGDR